MGRDFQLLRQLPVAEDLQKLVPPLQQALGADRGGTDFVAGRERDIEPAEVDGRRLPGRTGCENRASGIRRTSGIRAPSNTGLADQPANWPWPLCPRPDVLPLPEPGPRPTRIRFLCL